MPTPHVVPPAPPGPDEPVTFIEIFNRFPSAESWLADAMDARFKEYGSRGVWGLVVLPRANAERAAAAGAMFIVEDDGMRDRVKAAISPTCATYWADGDTLVLSSLT